MAHQQENGKSLHGLVNDYLHGKPMTCFVDEWEELNIEAMFDQLRKAERDPIAVRERLSRLKWKLAKARS